MHRARLSLKLTFITSLEISACELLSSLRRWRSLALKLCSLIIYMADTATSPDTRLQCTRSKRRRGDLEPKMPMVEAYTEADDGKAPQAEAVQTWTYQTSEISCQNLSALAGAVRDSILQDIADIRFVTVLLKKQMRSYLCLRH